jgi:hypothetical protein
MGASGTPSITTRNCTGPPRTVALTVAVTWLRVQRLRLSPGTRRQDLFAVVAGVVLHFAAWRSTAPPNAPVAATTAAGTAASRTTAPINTNLRMLGRLDEWRPQYRLGAGRF